MSSSMARSNCSPQSKQARGQDGVVDGAAVGLNLLVVHVVQGRDEEIRIHISAALRRREQGAEDGGLVGEVVVQNVGGAPGRVAGHGHAVEARGRVGRLPDDRPPAGDAAVACGEDAVVGEEGLDGARVEMPRLLDLLEERPGDGENESAGEDAGKGQDLEVPLIWMIAVFDPAAGLTQEMVPDLVELEFQFM
ncbi:hypothetical protein PG984_015533 [Apiospora sp. TS-2023a]